MNSFRDAKCVFYFVPLFLITWLNFAQCDPDTCQGFPHGHINVVSTTEPGEPNVKDFGEEILGSTSSKTINIESNHDSWGMTVIDVQVTDDNGGNNFKIDSFSGTIPAKDEGGGSIVISFIPQNTGTSNGTVTISYDSANCGNDGSHEISVSGFKGTSILKKNVVLLLDTSGSMGWHKTGSIEDLNGGCCSRLSSAKNAAKYFVNQLGSVAPDSKIGVAIFPGESAPSAVLGSQWPLTATGLHTLSTSNDIVSINNDIGGESEEPCGNCATIPLAPGTPALGSIQVNWNGTPTKAGLDAARNMLTSEPNTSPDTTFRAIVLLSDGRWTGGPVNDPADASYLGGFESDGIRIYTVAIGTGSDNFLPSSLQQITHLTGVGTGVGTAGYFPFNFENDNIATLITLLMKITSDMDAGLDFSSDPSDTIMPGETKIHKTLISGHETLVTFNLSWESSQIDLLNFFVLTPNGQCLEVQPKDSGNGYKSITVVDKGLLGDQNNGEWYMVVNYPHPYLHRCGDVGDEGIGESFTPIPRMEKISYDYNVMMRSTLNMRFTTNKNIYFTGDKMVMEARLIENNQPLKDANVIAEISRPETGLGNWHLLNQVSANIIHNAPSNISGEPFTLLDRKNYVLLQQQKVRLPGIISGRTIVLNDDGIDGDKNPDDGIYTGQFNGFDVQGNYEFKIVATGVASNGQEFRREKGIYKYVDVALDQENMVLGTVFKEATPMPLFPPELVKLLKVPPPEGFVRKSVIFTPKDRSGNLWGPGWANKIKYDVEDAEPLGSKVDNLDGSYIQVIEYNKRDNPSVKVSARGVTTHPIKIESDYIIWIIIAAIIITIIIIVLLRRRIKHG